MRTFSAEELNEILENHKLWLSLCGESGSRAVLREADLRGANLREANLRWAALYKANLSGSDGLSIPLVCPEEGSFIAFKRCRDAIIVKLEVTEDALRSSATTRKCRCSKAKVLSITNIDGTDSDEKYATSIYDSDFIYEVGKIVEVNNFDTNRFNECTTGIHFFMAREEAVNYEVI